MFGKVGITNVILFIFFCIDGKTHTTCEREQRAKTPEMNTKRTIYAIKTAKSKMNTFTPYQETTFFERNAMESLECTKQRKRKETL